MSEEEREALEKLNKLLEDWENNDITEIELFRINKLIEKQQKEIEQEKEKNKQILGDNIENFRKLFAEEFSKQFISKDKIREKIDNKLEYYNSYKGLAIYKKDNFKEIVITLEQLKQELLEEE